MSKCDSCVNKRPIAGEGQVIECRPEGISGEARLDGMYRFVATGSTSVPFSVSIVDVGLLKSANVAWPLRFDPEIIGGCDGYLAAENGIGSAE